MNNGSFWIEFSVLTLLGIGGILASIPYLRILFKALAASHETHENDSWGLAGSFVSQVIGIPIAVGLGLLLAHNLGLGLPVLEALLTQHAISKLLLATLAPSLLTGIPIGLFLLLITPRPDLPESKKNLLLCLENGLTEEIFLRLFSFSFVAWLLVRILNSSTGLPSPQIFWIANVVIALISAFTALSSFNSLNALAAQKTPPRILLRTFLQEGITGLVYGYLYWHSGLEAAMLTHGIISLIPKLRRPLPSGTGSVTQKSDIHPEPSAAVPNNEVQKPVIQQPVVREQYLTVEESTTQALRALVSASTEDEIHAVLEREADLLLTDNALRILDSSIRQSRGQYNEQTLHHLNLLRALLFESCILGFPTAWVNFQSSNQRAARAAQQAELQKQAEIERKRQAEIRAAKQAELDKQAELEREALIERLGLRKKWSFKQRVIYRTGPDAIGGARWSGTGSRKQSNPGPFRITTLQSWLLIPSYRDQRRFLEAHLELLNSKSDTELARMKKIAGEHERELLQIAGDSSGQIAETLQDLQVHQELLNDIHTRGGIVAAIRDVYVNSYGGFTLDLPAWLASIIDQLERTMPVSVIQAPRSPVDLLRDALIQARHDSAIAPETVAELQNELAFALSKVGGTLFLLEEALAEHNKALQIFTRERYPRQWLRTSLLIESVQSASGSLSGKVEYNTANVQVDELIERGKAFSVEKDFVHAAFYFERAIMVAPNNVEAWSNLSSAYKDQNILTEALVAAKQVVRLTPHNFEAWVKLASLYSQQKRHKEALAAYEHALSIDPGNADAWISKAQVLESLQNLEQALLAYDQALTQQPERSFLIWHNKGNILDKLGRYREALEAYDHILNRFPSFFATLSNKGSTLLKMKRYEEALATYKIALKSENRLTGLWFGRGTALLALGRYEEALSSLEQALTLDPTNTNAWNNIAVAFRMLKREIEASYASERAIVSQLMNMDIQKQNIQRIPVDTAQTFISPSIQPLPEEIKAQLNQMDKQISELYEKELYDETISVALQASILAGQYIDEKHPVVAAYSNSLAALYTKQGKYEQAELLYQKVLVSLEWGLGSHHPSTIRCLKDLAWVYYKQNKYEQAESLLERVVAIQEQVLGMKHPEVAADLTNLAMLYSKQDKNGQAEPLFQRALIIREQVLGLAHPDTRTSLKNLEDFYEKQG